MSRLTYKDGQNYYSLALKNFPFSEPSMKGSYAKACALDDAWGEERNKLGQLEDIEEEQKLGFLKCREIQKSRSVVLTNEFGFARELHDVYMYIGDGEVAIITKDDGIFYYQLSQYGQTWALTKEELL